jgi:hypothetical protein
MIDEDALRVKYKMVAPTLDERGRRLLLGAEAHVGGRGAVAAVARATGVSRSTVRRGRDEVIAPEGDSPSLSSGGVRRPGGGRRQLVENQPGLAEALDALIEPTTRGDPECPLRWTTKSTRKLSAELGAKGFSISPQVVGKLLHQAGYSLQALDKTREGSDHPDRDAQFHFIHAEVQGSLATGEPVISVDTKKKELVGNFKNGGKEWQVKGKPEPVRVHDFVDPVLGKAIPYGVYDVGRNEGWVNVGIDHDTAEFAVESIRRWWKRMGSESYPNATKLLVTADCGGSNSARGRAWKVELQMLALETGLTICVRHLPPGTSKWNKIEHRLFSHIGMNWRGRPLISTDVIVSLIGGTTSRTGLRVTAALDTGKYPTGVKVPDDIMSQLNIVRHSTHGDWNYDILPWLQGEKADK